MTYVELENCRRIVELLPWHANGSLDAERAAEVRAHIDECAACRREAAVLAAIIDNMPEPRPAHPGAAPFSQLLNRINRHERRVRGWKAAALALVTLAAVTAVAVPVYLFEPRYEAVTDPVPANGHAVQLEVRFDERERISALSELLQRYQADVLAGPSAEGVFLLEFRLAASESPDELRKRLEAESRVREVRRPER